MNILQTIKTWRVRGQQIETLNARIAELEKERDAAIDAGEATARELIKERDMLLRDVMMYESKLNKLDPNWREKTVNAV